MARNKRIIQEAIREQLERILLNAEFKKSESLCTFLRFVVEETLAGRDDQIKAYTIAVRALNRPMDFDAQNDTIVRVQARRLRRALRYYYATDGAQDPVLIEIPVGTYVPIFLRNKTDIEISKGKTSSAILALNDTAMAIPRGPSVVVLPFEILTDEQNQVYFADGLAAELVVALARFQEYRIIGPLSRDRLRDQDNGSHTIGQHYGAQFELRGSIREHRGAIRITIALTDVTTGITLWAQTFGRRDNVIDLFELEDTVVSQVSAILADDFGVIPRALTQQALEKRTGSIETYDAVLRYYHYVTVYTHEARRAARQALKHAVQIDPNYALTQSMLAVMYAQDHGFSDAEEGGLNQAISLAQRAVALDPQCQYARLVRAYTYFVQAQRDLFISETEQAISLNPNNAHVIGVCGSRLVKVAEWERGLKLLEKAMRLNPHHPGWYREPFFFFHYCRGQYQEALAEARRLNTPELFWDPLDRAAALGQLNCREEAGVAVRQLLDLRPDFAVCGRELMRRWVFFDEHIDMLLEGLQKAGLELVG